MGTLSAPTPLAPHHDISRFSSGVPALDAWLHRKARPNEAKGGARTYVACDGDRVAGFYSLAASSVERLRVSSRVGRNMPEPIPVILLGQLAVDTDYQGRRLGSDLLIDAAKGSRQNKLFISLVEAECNSTLHESGPVAKKGLRSARPSRDAQSGTRCGPTPSECSAPCASSCG